MTNTVCAVVVTYNRKKLLIECLDALINQKLNPDAIYIVDNNSTDKTFELLESHGYVTRNNFETSKENVLIKYIPLNENTGGAGGFYEGVKQAHLKYDWLWLMDDDAEVTPDCLYELKPYFNQENISALASLKVDANRNILFHHRGYFNFQKGLPTQEHITLNDTKTKTTKIDMASFVGILIKDEIITKIGYPKKEFFIHADDLEYCIRLREHGQILLINKSVILHKEGSVKGTFTKKKLGITANRRPYDKLWINYYMIRNLTWLGKKYTKNRQSFYMTIIKNYILSIIGIIIYDDHKINRIKFYTHAYNDGLREKFDNKKPKKILYQEKYSR
ncbi:MAG: glycosyltransferase family 2 protein [Methanobacteriaceae archaeon]|nr:glycosyltransferase family 2 protein [Methanobacteriaceae archaeon]